MKGCKDQDLEIQSVLFNQQHLVTIHGLEIAQSDSDVGLLSFVCIYFLCLVPFVFVPL